MAHVPSKIRKKVEWLLARTEGALLPESVLAEDAAHLAPGEARRKLEAAADDVKALGLTARVEQLFRALDGDPSPAPAPGEERPSSPSPVARRKAYVDQHGVCGVQRFHAGKETRIYLLPVETFPRHVNNVYLVLEPGSALLLDCGSVSDSTRRDLALGFAVVRAMFREEARFEDLDWCVISHAHMDHFSGANRLKRESRARIAVHELDARVLACFDERIVVASHDLDVFWRRAGIPDAERAKMVPLYQQTKLMFQPQEVDRVLRDGDLVGPGYRVHHVPGHCPGLICLQVHDVLLTSDHVLARITPHQFPQAITPFGGLENYFHSLAKVRKLEGINFALGGHEEPIWDLRARCDAIALFHRDRCAKVKAVCAEPKSVLQITEALFGSQESYGKILALEEAGAHVEYLHQLGHLRIANLDEVAGSRDPVLQYVAR